MIPLLYTRRSKKYLGTSVILFSVCLCFYGILKPNRTPILQDMQELRGPQINISFPLHVESENAVKASPDITIQLYAVNTDHCKLPYLDPYHREIRKYISKAVTYDCKKYPLPVLTRFERNKLEIDRLVLRDFYHRNHVLCSYQVIHRLNDTAVGLDPPIGFRGQTDVIADFVRVQCPLGNNTYVFYHTNVPRKPNVERRCKRIESLGFSPETYNVIVLGVDSVSRSNMIRQLPKSRGYLLKQMKAFEMMGYNKIADNTLPNLFAVLTGRRFQDVFKLKVGRKHQFDKAPFVWKNYAKSGYRTLLAEDDPHHGCFNHLQKGFNNTPTDYYYRPYALALEQERSLWWKRDCVGSVTEVSLVLDYVRKFAEEFRKDKFFAFAFLSRLTHNDPNRAHALDEQLTDFFTDLKQRKVLDNTVIVFLSDHGTRYGSLRGTEVGSAEERLPALYLAFPSDFLTDYPGYAINLQLNQNRLTTPYDVYQTLKALLSLDDAAILQKQVPKLPITERAAFSLLTEVAEARDCTTAEISRHWCMCRAVSKLDVDDAIVRKAVEHALFLMRGYYLAYPELCTDLSLGAVLKAHYLLPSEVLRQRTNLKTYMVTFTTTPGGATYEATLDYDINTKMFDLVGTMSRTDAYATKSQCVNDKMVRLYCHCKRT